MSVNSFARQKQFLLVGLKKSLCVLLTTTALCGAITSTQAQEETIAPAEKLAQFSIPAGSLGAVISQIGKVSNLQVLYPSDLIRNKLSNGLYGTMTGAEALDHVLKNTGLHFQYMNEGTITILSNGDFLSEALATHDDVELNTIFISAGDSDKIGTIRVSGEVLQEKFSDNIDEALRAQPGVYTRSPVDQEGITVNIRGMQGGGRVNSMIDGVPQNFRNVSGHGSTTDPLVFIDPLLVRSIDIKKGWVRGAEGMGTLSGAANFRTIEADDILLDGRNIGFMTNVEASTNGVDHAALAASAARFSHDDIGTATFLAAFTHRKVGPYKTGDGELVPSDPSLQDEIEPTSGVFKFDYSPNDEHYVTLNGNFYENKFMTFTTFAGPGTGYRWNLRKEGISGSYTYTPDNPWISFRTKAHLGTVDLVYPKNTGGAFAGRESQNTSYGFDATNISTLPGWADTQITLEYGGALQGDKYESNESRGGNPDGELIKSGLFGDATVEWNKFTLNAGIRYDMWQIEGVRTYHAAGTNGCPAGGNPCPDEKASNSGGEFNPSVGLAYMPFDGVRLFGNVALSSRAPTISEVFASSHDFSGLGTPGVNNLALKPERQRGIDLGFEVDRNNILLANDNFRFGMSYFHNRIDDYIGVGVNPFMTPREFLVTAGTAIRDFDIDTLRRLQDPDLQKRLLDEQMQYQNAADPVYMSGVEISAGYDAGRFYVNGLASFLETDQPFSETSVGLGNDIGTIPKVVATLDFGTRWLDEKLTIGGLLRYTGKSKQYRASELNFEGNPADLNIVVVNGGHIDIPAYTLFDVYANYEPNKNLKFFASVGNVFDLQYRPANTSSDSGLWNSETRESTEIGGPGRTFRVGAKLIF
ncbi:MAG: TonB-dependent receptor [Pseudomonadota bacterium]